MVVPVQAGRELSQANPGGQSRDASTSVCLGMHEAADATLPGKAPKLQLM